MMVRFLRQLLALCLSVALGLPSPALALKSQEVSESAGLEELKAALENWRGGRRDFVRGVWWGGLCGLVGAGFGGAAAWLATEPAPVTEPADTVTELAGEHPLAFQGLPLRPAPGQPPADPPGTVRFAADDGGPAVNDLEGIFMDGSGTILFITARPGEPPRSVVMQLVQPIATDQFDLFEVTLGGETTANVAGVVVRLGASPQEALPILDPAIQGTRAAQLVLRQPGTVRRERISLGPSLGPAGQGPVPVQCVVMEVWAARDAKEPAVAALSFRALQSAQFAERIQASQGARPWRVAGPITSFLGGAWYGWRVGSQPPKSSDLSAAGVEEPLTARAGQQSYGMLLTSEAAALATVFARSNHALYAAVVETREQAAGLEELGVPKRHLFVMAELGATEASTQARAFLERQGAATIHVLSALATELAALRAQLAAFLRDTFEPVSAATEQHLLDLVLQAQAAFQA